ncbi:DEAD/DEAH box helicase [Corynebacterium sp. A21]|uniref:DEAD/DEAH box helicase n=1 Tax=Corynebacterium sp. A21 TaxID=3457318 RepID=UPI003FD4AA35
MSTVKDVIAALQELPTNAERGYRFEDLMVRYFHLDPVLSNRYEHVSRWNDWEHNGGRPDNGVDLVARNREDGTWTAIQCKFYEPTTHLQKSHLDSFFTESGKTFTTPDGPQRFTNRMIISTTDRWGKNAEAAIEDQTIPVQRIGLDAIAESPINWDIAYPGSELAIDLAPKPRFEPRPHQAEAIAKTLEGFATHDRGKLIMACGTGKTFTSLKLAEQVAQHNGGRAKILFVVPSISLLGQTLREWTANSALDLRSFAVCSDRKVSKAAEDIKAYDLEIPVTTDGTELAAALASGGRRAAGLQVVFSTYQSLPAVHAAQQAGADPFDLVICDEAHRTTGVTLAGEDPSHFTRIHDADYLQATKRLYMTATPRLFDEATKGKAEEHFAEVASMDDEAIYGPEFHRLGFGEAVEKGLLTDYKVLVLAVDEDVAAETAQRAATSVEGDLTLDVTSKIIGCWNGLAKRSGRDQDTSTGFETGAAPMQRAVAFAQDIKASTQVAEAFPRVIEQYTETLREKSVLNPEISGLNLDLTVAARHVDGTMNALERGQKLSWLKSPLPGNEVRILSNARCLSEGVDVPALDAVLFLNPRNSMVDVVQSVGRVMRKAEGKDYGYIILPVGVPAGVVPSQALADNRRFRVVWQVLNALRAHDDRFNAMVNSIAVNTTGQGDIQGLEELAAKIEVDHIADQGTEPTSEEERLDQSAQMTLFSLQAWQEAMYTKIVTKVGDRGYWEDWADDVADIAAAQTARINALLVDASPQVRTEFEAFVEGLRGNLNESITAEDAVNMLSQHLITAPVFDALFAEHDFASHNPVSKVMQRMVTALDDSKLDAETEKLDSFYASVRVRASEVTSAAGKQSVIKDLYERFFKKAFKKQSEALGIVYTPVEIVDFILRAADDVSKEHFGRGLSDEGVHVLDPFTGTGTFMVRLLQSGLIKPADLARKYAAELHATEIMLLAYYVAAVNIETTYHALLGEKALREGVDAPGYEPFEGIALADTFQVHEDDDTLDAEVFAQNNARIERQKHSPIQVIVGNPPYSVGQTSANDLNANIKYPTLDGKIEQTFVARSTGTNKNSLYDSYLRAFRWATDRIEDQGVVAFVSNGGWVDGNTADGVRLSLAADYSDIYVFNLRGNQRTAGEQSRREGGKVFGSGSRNTVAIFIGVKRPGVEGCRIHYRDIGDYLTTEEKLKIVNRSEIATMEWAEIQPNSHGDWVSQRSDDFSTWPVLGDKKNTGVTRFFESYSRGLETGRDAWVYNYSANKLRSSVQHLIKGYNSARSSFHDHGVERSPFTESGVNDFLTQNPDHADGTKVKWSRSLRTTAAKNIPVAENPQGYVTALYRPFSNQHGYFDRYLNHERGQLPSMFPTPHHDNLGIYQVGAGSAVPFSIVATNLLPNLHVTGAGSGGQFFSRWIWELVEAPEGMLDFAGAQAVAGEPGTEGEVLEGHRRVDNITDEILVLYRDALGQAVSKDDIFYFVYGQLHDPGYREAYAADLKKMLPHIETPADRARFDQLSTAGRELMTLHIGYENVEPWPLDIQVKQTADQDDRETWRVTKLKWKKIRDPETTKLVDDRTTMIYNPKVTIAGIPLEAEEYMLGSRSALAWIIDRYQVKTDKASGIVNDPNDWADEVGNPRHIVELIGKVTRVAVETQQIVNSLADKA